MGLYLAHTNLERLHLFVASFLKARSASPNECLHFGQAKKVPQIAAIIITYHLNSVFLPHEQQVVELSKWTGSWVVYSGKIPLIISW
jgi:hypothetical protein